MKTDVDSIPDSLKERDQWLLWASDSEPAKVPLNESGYPASWNDPGSWLSFEHAVELAQSRPAFDSVGFAVAENDPFVVLDLDGCLRESHKEKPKDWLPDIGEFMDTYVQYSQSGTGLHVFTERDGIPEKWSHTGPDGAHTGVEAYEQKFIAMTGDRVETAEKTIEPVDIVPFLREVWEKFEDEPWENHPDGRDVDTPDDAAPTGNAKEIAEAVNRLDAREVAEETIVSQWNDDHTAGGDNRAFYPTWGGADCNGRANIVDPEGWTDTGTSSGSGGPLEMAAIDMGDLSHSGCKWGDVSGELWWKAVDHLRDLGFDIPEYESDGNDTEASIKINPEALLREADLDPAIPIALGGEDEPTLRALQASEAAHAAWRVFEKAGVDRELLGVESGPLYGYDGGIWTRERGETLLRNYTLDALGPQFTQSAKNNVEERVRKAREIPADGLGAPDATVATESGLLDLETRDTKPLKPKHRATVKVKTEYDETAECPEFKEFINEVVTSGDRKKLQEYCGYTLWHHAQPYGKALFLLGPTDSGKGALLRILKKLLGDNAVASQTLKDLVDSRWGPAHMYGTWVNIRNEVSPDDVSGVERFKELTGGGDRIDAEFKGEQKFEYDVYQKFIFAMNQMPGVEDADPAFWNRLLIVEFGSTIPEADQDPNLDDRLVENESAGILNWMLDGLHRLHERGGFTNERTEKAKRQVCNAFGGPLDRFFEEAVEITGDDYDMVVKSDLNDMATAYAKEKDMEPTWSSQSGFTRKVTKEIGVDHMRTRELGNDRDRDDVYTGIVPDENMIEELDVNVKFGNISSDSGQQTF